MNQEDYQLVEACRSRDQLALKQLYDRFSSKMYALCLRYTHTDDAAQDVLHDGFIKIFDKIDQLRSSDSLDGWVRSVMVNTAISYLRHEKRNIDSTLVDEDIEASFNYNDSAFNNLDIQVILAAIRQLPPQARSVFNLIEIEGFSPDEVAMIMGITQKTVKANLLRAKRVLSQKLLPLSLR